MLLVTGVGLIVSNNNHLRKQIQMSDHDWIHATSILAGAGLLVTAVALWKEQKAANNR
jgi:hypothetical protein